MFNVKVRDMHNPPAHMLAPFSIDQLQKFLSNKCELIITQEGLTQQQIQDGFYRVASFGEDDKGSTYFIGTHKKLDEYVRSLV